jgi:hypothetical protein
MDFSLLLSTLADHPFGTALLFVIVVVVAISLAIAVYSMVPLLGDVRRERRKQHWQKKSSVPVWIGRTSP